MSRSCKWSLSIRSSHQIPVCISPVPHLCHMFIKIISTSRDYDPPVYSLGFNTRLLLTCKAMNFNESTGYEPSFTPPQTTQLYLLYCSNSCTSLHFNLSDPCVLYIGRAYCYPPDVAFYIYFFQQI
jgi:hypothetical protein